MPAVWHPPSAHAYEMTVNVSERAVQIAVVRYDMNGKRYGSMACSTRVWALAGQSLL